ncbi:11333_t:CDS:1, partial [Scutellospora calospora]
KSSNLTEEFLHIIESDTTIPLMQNTTKSSANISFLPWSFDT